MSAFLPMKGPLSSATVQSRLSSNGEYRCASIVAFRAGMYSTSARMSPASMRATSKASIPAGVMSCPAPFVMRASQSASARSRSTQISSPRSPVYPVREIWTGIPSNFVFPNRKYFIFWTAPSAPSSRIARDDGPCKASAPISSDTSVTVTSRPIPASCNHFRFGSADDGTLWNFGDGSFRLTSAEPNLKWLQEPGMGLHVPGPDVLQEVGARALQGPSSGAILLDGADGAVQKMKYFRFVKTKFDGIPVHISRTGYTGDLGYEIWVERERAEALWDALMTKGAGYDITPAGMLALDVARIEAGLILAEVEYMPARKATIDAQRYSPFELSLDWTVALDKGPFIGRKALIEEKRRGPSRRTVGLVIAWRTIRRFYLDLGLPPQQPAEPWREKGPR